MVWPVEKRTPYAGIKERMADGSEGARMRRIKGARHAHAAMRAQGRTPGGEGRAVIAHNRAIRAEQKRRDKITQLSAITTGTKGPDGLTREQREANELLKKQWAEMEAARVERLRQEWLARQERLASPASERRTGITGSMCSPH